MHSGASSSSTISQYERPPQKKARVIKFDYNENEFKPKLDSLIKTDKSGEVAEDNIRADYQKMAYELLSELLPFEIPTELNIQKQQDHLKHLKTELQAVWRGERSSNEAMEARKLYEEKKEFLEKTQATLQALSEINQQFLTNENLHELTDYIGSYCEGIIANNLNGINFAREELRKIVNNLLADAKTQIFEKFPMHFDAGNVEFKAGFDRLAPHEIDHFRLRYAQIIVRQKNIELADISQHKDTEVEKEKLKEQILSTAEMSQLQYDIMNAISKRTDSEYLDKVIGSALDPILEQFAREQHFGAYQFRYPRSVREELSKILEANSDLLIARESNETELEYYTEQFNCFSELKKRPSKYGVTTLGEGTIYEGLASDFEKKLENAKTARSTLNQSLAQIIETFINDNTLKQNQDTIEEIQNTLNIELTNQNHTDVMRQAEKKTELGYYDWMFTKTFASRCKRGLIMATTLGTVGFAGGGLAGLGILSPLTAGIGGVSGGVTGFVAGFAAPNIEAAAVRNVDELKNLAISFFYGEQNEILKEYFEDPRNTKILARKYTPTQKMLDTWGVDGANVIAHHYANLLFELHIKILYGKDDKARQDLELQYKHFYRNYQMIRGDQVEISKIYQADVWGAERTENEIRKLGTLDIVKLAKEDLAILMMIVKNDEQANIKKLRTAVNNVANGLRTLGIEENTDLLRQALDAPEVKRLPQDFIQDVAPKQLLITARSHTETPQPRIQSSSSASSSSASSSSASSSSASSSSASSSSVSSSSVSSSGALSVITEAPLKIVAHDTLALEKQRIVTYVKEGAADIALASQRKHEIEVQYVKLKSLATITAGPQTITRDIGLTSPDFIRLNTHFDGDMNAFEATASLLSGNVAFFRYWYNNIFLYNNKSASNLTRKELISQSLRSRDGLIQFNGKSLWHILAENNSQGREIFAQMMREQNEARFSPFIDYFDFDYKPINDMNAIVYAASLSTASNSEVFRSYVDELMIGYQAHPEHRASCDKTFKEVLQLKSPLNPAYHVICMKLKDEIHSVWNNRVQTEYQAKTWTQTFQGALSARPKFDSDTILSQLLATLAIHCTEGHPVPQTEPELINFINKYKQSRYITPDIQVLLNHIETVNNIAKVSSNVTKNNPLYNFSITCQDEQLRNLAIELCTSEPVPSTDEQAILEAILQNKIQFIEKLIEDGNSTLAGLIKRNTKFKEKNLLWIAIEANRPQIASMIYNMSSTHDTMDKAGPDNASAFAFAASRDDKTAFSSFCNIIGARKVGRAYAKRFKASPSGEIAFHYLAQNGSIDNIKDYLRTEERNTYPKWHKLTSVPPPASILKGDEDRGKFYIDHNRNLPLHLLLSREDAPAILREMQTYVESKQKDSIFDLFPIEAFNERNTVGITPMSLVMSNDALQRVIFEPFIDKKKVSQLYTIVSFREKLFTCARFAFEHDNAALLEQLMNSIQDVHTLNVGHGILTNPVEQEVDRFLDYLISRLGDAKSDWDINHICRLIEFNAKLASARNLKRIITNATKPLFNQRIYDAVLPAAVERKIVKDSRVLASTAAASSSTSASISAATSSSAGPENNEDTSSRVSLLLSGGHQIAERESPSATSDPHQRKGKQKMKRDQS